MIDVHALGRRKRVEQIGREIRIRVERVVSDDDRVIDRIETAQAQRVEAGFLRVRDERLHVRRVHLHADGRRDVAGLDEPFERPARFDGDDVGGRPVFGDVLVAGEDPRHLAQFDAVLVLQDAAHPESRRHGVAAVDADPLAFEILRRADAGVRVVDDGAMMKRAHREDGNRGERLAVGARAQVRRHRQLADVEVEVAHHSAKRVDDDRHVFELEVERARLHRPVLERLGVPARRERGLQSFGHTIMLCCRPP